LVWNFKKNAIVRRPMSAAVHPTPSSHQKASDIFEVSLAGKIPTETYKNLPRL